MYNQLILGARYLDLRTCPKGKNYYFCHALYGDQVAPALKGVAKFAKDHPKEIIILDFQHFYGFDNSKHRTMVDGIQHVFGSRLIPAPKADCTFPKIGELWRQNKNVLVIYSNGKGKGPLRNWRWNSDCLNDHYKSGGWQSTKSLKSAQAEKLRIRDMAKFWKVQGVLTANESMLAEGFLPGNPHTLMDIGGKLNGEMVKWLRDWKVRYRRQLNIFMIDNYGATTLHENLVKAAMGK